MGLLSAIGRILALIAGIFILVSIIVNLLQAPVNLPVDPASQYRVNLDGLVGLIIMILAAVGLIMSFNNRWGINEEWLEGLVVIILAWLAGTTLGLVGGILILISGLL